MRTDDLELDCPACGQPILLPSLESATYAMRCPVCEHVFTDEDLLLGRVPVNLFRIEHEI